MFWSDTCYQLPGNATLILSELSMKTNHTMETWQRTQILKFYSLIDATSTFTIGRKKSKANLNPLTKWKSETSMNKIRISLSALGNFVVFSVLHSSFNTSAFSLYIRVATRKWYSSISERYTFHLLPYLLLSTLTTTNNFAH